MIICILAYFVIKDNALCMNGDKSRLLLHKVLCFDILLVKMQYEGIRNICR